MGRAFYSDVPALMLIAVEEDVRVVMGQKGMLLYSGSRLSVLSTGQLDDWGASNLVQNSSSLVQVVGRNDCPELVEELAVMLS